MFLRSRWWNFHQPEYQKHKSYCYWVAGVLQRVKMVCKDWSLSPRLISSMSLKGNPGVTALTTASTIFRIRIRMSFIARYVSQIGQVHSPLNHSAHRHLSINCTHLFGINTLIRTPSKAHTSLHSVSGLVYTKWTLSMLSKRYIEIPTFCTYTILPKVLGHPLLMNRFDYSSNFHEYNV